MLYSNIDVKSEEKVCDFGTIHQINVGESGRGRRMMSIVCPENTEIVKGYNEAITVTSTRSGKPRFSNLTNGELYLLLSTSGGYTRRGDGYVQVLNSAKDNVQVLASGNGADGMAGRIGTWSCKLLKVTGDTVIRVKYSGGYTPSDMVIVRNGSVMRVALPDILSAYDAMDADVPFGVTLSENGTTNINPDEWSEI